MLQSCVLFAPLIGAILCGFGHRALGERAALAISLTLVVAAAILSWGLFLFAGSETDQILLMRFVESGTLSSDWAIRYDRLTAVMLIVVTTVSALVHVYSLGYMDNDENWQPGESYKPRFFAYLSFFTFAMLALVTSDNLLQLFFGWEGVGVASYLLIGFYFRKPSANAAAIKAFIVNRVGDFGFALGIFLLYLMVDSVHLDDIFAAAPDLAAQNLALPGFDISVADLAAILLFVGAAGKSAQIFLHTWLPDAMEGPTPVSALIHAATMVTAGVFLVCRMSPLFEYAPLALAVVAAAGAITAIFAASVGLVQNDIKRVIAYSTCSQLGYMFAAAGLGAYQAALFHLFTHAFFKALLFLGAGAVIHAMHHEQDMRNYGGLRRKLPVTYLTMLIATLAITGVGIPLTHIGLAGFLSKDAIIESAYMSGSAVSGFTFLALVSAAVMTSFYSWRLMFMTFFAAPRGSPEQHASAHEAPRVMLVPLLVLAAGSAFAGMIWYDDFLGYGTAKFFQDAIFVASDNTILHDAHEAPAIVKTLPFLAMLLGLGLAWLFYLHAPALPARLAAAQRPIYLFLYNKWYFDEIYHFLFLRPANAVARLLWRRGDGMIIDGALHAVALRAVPFLTRTAGRAQTGYLFHYALAMVVGAVLIIAVVAGTGP